VHIENRDFDFPIAQVLQLYDAADREKLLFRSINDKQWTLIEGRIERLFAHKIWDDPNPDVHFSTKDQRGRAGP
jgi:hypothetical protein